MLISPLSTAWIIMFAFQLVLIFALYFYGRKKSDRQKEKLFLFLFIFLVLFYVWYKSYLIWGSKTYETSVWNELPLALCQVASFLAYPAVKSKNRTLLGFCFFIGSLCSLMGMLMPVAGFSGIPLLSCESIGYYGFHGFVFVQAITLYTLRIYNPDSKDVPKICLFLASSALVVHFINMLLRATVLPDSNYFFTYDPEGNPVLTIFRNLIDVNYLYLLPLIVPVGIVLALLALVLKRKKK